MCQIGCKSHVGKEKSNRERIEKYTNSAHTIVSKHEWLLKAIDREYDNNVGSGEPVGDKKFIAKTNIYGGLEIYVDDNDELWAGDREWVIPIDLTGEWED